MAGSTDKLGKMCCIAGEVEIIVWRAKTEAEIGALKKGEELVCYEKSVGAETRFTFGNIKIITLQESSEHNPQYPQWYRFH